MPSSEETPLLSENDVQARHDAIYRRFSPARKLAIVGMVSGCGLIPLFVTGSFTPSIPQIAKDLDTTGSIINLAVSLSAFAASVGGLIGGSYSTMYGRRAIYTFSLPILVLGSIGVATASNIPSLLFWRFMQALGASPGQVLGAGVIGDIYKLEERGRGMAVFFAAVLLGPSLAPLVGGWTTFHYSWRIMQGSLGMVGFVAFCIMYFFFPETSQPGTRGIDKLRAIQSESTEKRIGFVFVNPLRPMLLLRSPNLLLISIILSASLITVFVLLVPLAYTIGQRYNIANEALIGACFLPAGLGNMTGAALVGRISDRTVINWRKKRGGVWYPEDRLRASLIPFALIVPIPLIIYGLANQFVDGTPGLVICLVCLFINGIGVEMAFGPCAAYLVDVMHSRSAEALAANGGLRSVLMAAGIAVVLPMINTFGIAITNAVCAVMVWIAFVMLCCIIRYGDQMRAWVDVGFSTAENN
ncbi:MFS general substrate transporter [Gymnopilus junonius]|uniref:MFS general substrate transporter n=1 Tax=Gymnopilus junonius TaxID=109634 RepID=A0A9P5NA52_GYMJU|nr:MFS general substrate transporter [Gymnopilus junonius]